MEIVNVKEDMNKQLQEAEMILETEKQKLLKVKTHISHYHFSTIFLFICYFY